MLSDCWNAEERTRALSLYTLPALMYVNTLNLDVSLY